MHSHRLILDDGPRSAEWLLEWDESTFTLKGPDGQPVLQTETPQAHRLIEIYELYEEGKISFETPAGSLTFKKQRAAANDLRALVDAGLRSDAEYRLLRMQRARRLIPFGLAMSIVGAIPLALFSWWAWWANDGPGNWIRPVALLAQVLLLVVFAMTLAGPCLCLSGLRELRRIRRTERFLANGVSHGDVYHSM